MGRGSSGLSGGGGGTKTPSGMTLNDLMKMPEAQRYDAINNIISDPTIKVPDTLDGSVTSKLMYALGMDGKPTVVSDAQLDAMQGREIFRTVYESGIMPPPATDMILDQIRVGDYTQMSGSGGSFHGRALYFATDFSDSAVYGSGERNPMIMRGKINANANIRSENSLSRQMMADTTFTGSKLGNRLSGRNSADAISLYAISHGVDGWYSGTYTMMVNRGVLTMSSQNKSIYSTGRSRASSWSGARSV